MKIKTFTRTVLSTLLAVCLLAGCLLPAFAQSRDALIEVDSAQRGTFAAADTPQPRASFTLSQALKNLLRNAVLNTRDTIDVEAYGIPYSTENWNLITEYLFNHVPEAFHLLQVRCQYYIGGEFISFSFTYSCTAAEFTVQSAQCTKVANQLLSGIKNNNNLSDVEKALLLHDRLALHCEYGNPYADHTENATLYAALVGRKPICQGYSVAYSYLLEQVGIKSEITSSDTLNHAWNIVYINNIPYHVDVTWDDPIDDIYGRVWHYNFMLSTAALKAGVGEASAHDADDFNHAPSNTTYDNYFWQNSIAAFQLLDNEIYYIDSVEQRIERMSDHSAVVSVADTWHLSDDGWYLENNQARLACVNNTLYCSMPTAVYKVDVSNGTKSLFYEPDLIIDGEQFFCIAGFAIEAGTMYFDYCNYRYGAINTVRTSATIDSFVIYGDIDNDGVVSAGDARLALRASVGLEILSAAEITIADVDNDNAVTAGDARLILRYSVGLENKLPA
ncbi:MAG: hypothetical protein E7523_13090 [Ruminococcaceae bacterium]|nr:hypothetical protein [Oscillospiraceae bacterium]